MNLMLLLLVASGLPEWMAGCWSGQKGSIVYEEQWNRPVGGSMMGMARTLKAHRVIFSEFMRIDSTVGRVTYTPRIGTKQGPVEFVLKSQSGSEVVFENPAHDFPQRIRYKLTPAGLHARIEGTDKGKERSEEFPMKAIACK